MDAETCENSVNWINLLFFTLLLVTSIISTSLLSNQYPAFNIYMVSKHGEVPQICQTILSDCSLHRVVGFDAEWVTKGKTRQPVALLQLCSPRGTCALFRLNSLKTFPVPLKEILEDPSLIKVGVTPENDANYLLKDYGVNVTNTLDLRFLYPTNGSLAKLSQDVLGITLNKHYRIRCSDWEANVLTDEQISYAGMDAYVAVEVFKKWAGISFKTFWRQSRSWNDIEADFVELYNAPFKNCSVKSVWEKQNTHREKSWKNEGISSLKFSKLKSRFTTRKARVYDNCLMTAPDGTLLCSTRKSKAEWYIRQGRAELISEEPYVIRLLFEPKVKPGDGEQLYDKELKCDQCVVCGATEGLLKHNVVPRFYRKHFPLCEKSHKSHDVLVFCITCHLIGEKYVTSLIDKLNKLAGVVKQKDIKTEKPNDPSRYAKALLSQQNIPEARRLEMATEIKQYYKTDEVDENFLRDLLERKEKLKRKSGSAEASDGKIVVEYYLNEGHSIFDLQKMWRQHFVDAMKPKFLPKYWSVDKRN